MARASNGPASSVWMASSSTATGAQDHPHRRLIVNVIRSIIGQADDRAGAPFQDVSMLIVTGYKYVEPSLVGAFARHLQTLGVAARQREGNLSYDAAVDDALAGRLLIAERWRDQAALTAHLHAADTMALVARWGHAIRGELLKYDALHKRDLI